MAKNLAIQFVARILLYDLFMGKLVYFLFDTRLLIMDFFQANIFHRLLPFYKISLFISC